MTQATVGVLKVAVGGMDLVGTAHGWAGSPPGQKGALVVVFDGTGESGKLARKVLHDKIAPGLRAAGTHGSKVSTWTTAGKARVNMDWSEDGGDTVTIGFQFDKPMVLASVEAVAAPAKPPRAEREEAPA